VKAGSDEGARPLNLASTKMKTGVENSRRAFLQYFFWLQKKSTKSIDETTPVQLVSYP
jgi:hypothetical protein